MPSKDKFDEILKNKFEGFEAPLPSGGFGAIRDRIPRKRRRGGFLLPLMTAASLFFATLSGYLLLKQYDIQSNQATEKEQSQNITDLNKNNVIASNDVKVSEQFKNVNDESINQEPNTVESLNQNSLLANADQVINNSNQGSNAAEVSSIANNSNGSNGVVINPIALVEVISVSANGETEVGEVLVVEETKNTENLALTNLNPVNQGINPAMLRHIVLAETEGVERLLTGMLDVELVETFVDENEDEEETSATKWHLGISAAPVYTSKRIYANEQDNVIVTQYKGINKFDTENAGFNVAGLVGYDLNPKIQLLGKIDFSKVNDNNTFEIAEERAVPLMIVNADNSVSYSKYSKREVNVAMSNLIAGLNTSIKYNLGCNNNSYISAGGGLHYLLTANQKGGDIPFQNHKTNFSSAFAIGRKYYVTEQLSLNIEPELRYYFKAFQKDGAFESKPYTLGLNFIFMR